MKSSLPLFIIIITTQLSLGQSMTFPELIELYKKGSNRKIDNSAAFNFFDFESFPQIPNLKTGQILWTSNDLVALTSITECLAGGICTNTKLSTFSSQGVLIDRISFESEMADCVFNKERTNTFFSDSLLIFTNLDFEVQGCEEDEVIVKNDLQVEYVNVSNGKFQDPIVFEINTSRKYMIGSIKFLNSSDIVEYSKNELAIIRNEIFAAHGYTFRTSQWQRYFSAQEWYEARLQNVDESLTLVERHNIKFLLEAENK